jgi:RNA polymerase sigma-70 factor (ECF subfamily)
MSGSDELLARLARERGRDLVAYAFLFTGDQAAAQDLVQDAFVKVFGRFRAGYDATSAEAYTRRTIATLYIDGYRRRRHYASLEPLLVDAESHEPDPAAALDVRAALAGLSRQERACVVLRYFADRTVPEVARELHLAEGTVKRYLSHATHKLETVLGPLAGTDETIDVLPSAGRDGSGR